MSKSTRHRQLAEALFLPIVNGGGARAVAVPAATLQTREKTDRLRALRLERDRATSHRAHSA